MPNIFKANYNILSIFERQILAKLKIFVYYLLLKCNRILIFAQ